jgi:hypothetical protein
VFARVAVGLPRATIRTESRPTTMLQQMSLRFALSVFLCLPGLVPVAREQSRGSIRLQPTKQLRKDVDAWPLIAHPSTPAERSVNAILAELNESMMKSLKDCDAHYLGVGSLTVPRCPPCPHPVQLGTRVSDHSRLLRLWQTSRCESSVPPTRLVLGPLQRRLGTPLRLEY